MAERYSLADEAVDVLASVSRMTADLENEHDERHQVRTLKRLAEQVLADAFRHARELTFIAEDIRKDAEARRTAGVNACAHSWHDFGQLGGRNVVWCGKCEALAFAGQEGNAGVAVTSQPQQSERSDG